MALRVIGQIIPSGTTVFRAANVAQKVCAETFGLNILFVPCECQGQVRLAS